MAEEKVYQVIVDTTAQRRYRKTILSYLTEHFSSERVLEIDQELMDESRSLRTFPGRGRKEERMSSFKEDFRYILYTPAKNFDIKIIYFINEASQKVFITDFFPTKMDTDRMMR